MCLRIVGLAFDDEFAVGLDGVGEDESLSEEDSSSAVEDTISPEVAEAATVSGHPQTASGVVDVATFARSPYTLRRARRRS